MPYFSAPAQFNNFQAEDFRLTNAATGDLSTALAGKLEFDTTLGRPVWGNGAVWIPVPRQTDVSGTDAETNATGSGIAEDTIHDSLWAYTYGNTFLADGLVPVATSDTEPTYALDKVIPGVFSGFFLGVSNRSCGFAEDAPLTIDVTGKATASAVEITTTGGLGETPPTYSLNITGLTVADSDITLADGLLLVGDSGGTAAATAKSAIPLSGFGAAAANIALGGNKITGLGTCTADTDAANKLYVDTAVSLGNAPKSPVRVATTTALPAFTYSGPSPRKLVADAAGAFPTVDGVTLSLNDRILVKDETSTDAKYNGTYTITVVGDGSNPWELTRGTEEDTDSEVVTGIAYFVTAGTENAGREYTLSTTGTITLDTTSLTFVQTGGSVAYTSGNGIVISGTSVHFGQSSSYTSNTIPYASGAASIGFISAGSAYQSLRVPSGGGAPAFGAIDISQSAATTGALPANRGGTGYASYTEGDLLCASGASTLGKIGGAAPGNVLLSQGTTTAPSYGKVTLTGHVSGTLPVANGGTGATSHTANGLLVGAGTSAVTNIWTTETAAIVVTAAGGVPGWVVPPSSGDVTIAADGTMTVGANKVSLAKMAQVTGPIVLGRSSGTGNVQALSATTLAGLLSLSGTNTGDQTITLSGDVTGTGTGAITVEIGAGKVGTTELADDSVTTAKIAANAVTATELDADSVTNAKLATDAVGTSKIAGYAVTTAKLADNSVTSLKMRQGAALSVIGVTGASTSNVDDIAAGVVGSASANKVFRVDNAGTTLAFGALNLSSTNAVTGILDVAYGGTGTDAALEFPTIAGEIAMIYKTGIASGSASYSIANPFGDSDVQVQVWTAAGVKVEPDISRTATHVVLGFGGVNTAVAHRVVITGNNLS